MILQINISIVISVCAAYAVFTELILKFPVTEGFIMEHTNLMRRTSLHAALQNNLLIRAARGEKVERTPVSNLSYFSLLLCCLFTNFNGHRCGFSDKLVDIFLSTMHTNCKRVKTSWNCYSALKMWQKSLCNPFDVTISMQRYYFLIFW